MLHSISTSLLWRGVLAIVVGLIAIFWPGVTVAAVVVVFAILAFTDAILQGSRAFSSRTAGPVAGHLFLALVDAAAGVVALTWPGITAWALVILIGAWAIVTGVGEVAMAFAAFETAGRRVLFALGGLLSIALGVVLFARPTIGAVSLAEAFGLFCLAYGVASLVMAESARDAEHSLSHAAT
jgi:uncharacterized membrane protein HdeD (DUF308 family)